MMQRQRQTVAVWVVVVASGLGLDLVALGVDDPARWVPDVVVGWSLLACAIVLAQRRAGSPVGGAGALTTVIVRRNLARHPNGILAAHVAS